MGNLGKPRNTWGNLWKLCETWEILGIHGKGPWRLRETGGNLRNLRKPWEAQGMYGKIGENKGKYGELWET